MQRRRNGRSNLEDLSDAMGDSAVDVPRTKFSAMMDAALSQPEDRKLFGLPVAEPEEHHAEIGADSREVTSNS